MAPIPSAVVDASYQLRISVPNLTAERERAMSASQPIRVLVATQTEQVYEILKERGDVHYDIALYTGTISDLLSRVQLVIIDYDDIAEYPLSEVDIRERIFAAQVRECSSEDFVATPDSYLDAIAMSHAGAMLSLPDRYSIAFVSYSGGVGRTTLAMDTAYYYVDAAKRFRDKSRRTRREGVKPLNATAMLAELCYGASSLISVTGLDMPSLMPLATSPEADAHLYRGVSHIPMDYDNVRMLDVDLLQRYFTRQMGQHALTVIDGIWPHGLAGALVQAVDLWVVVASERADTMVNALRLYDELAAEYGEGRVWRLQNQVEDMKKGDGDIPWNIRVPRISRPDEFRGEMGRIVLSKVFAPLWATIYDVQNKSGSRKKA